ncbi:hypothetical protein ABER61_15610 [Brevibacillus formosus]|uniref:Uncharacterized protein n=1 Tax=Brevibacillus formosus TaxID=54913 RepID=A0A837KRP9_9BACL|nr:hypothetical protein [Brevibacillus formosus]KLH98849.1 hypothetical protein AA984_09960 [Brevibacillus formosus]MED1958153.1 hypothetical protein [Brevibacillus formosus]PSJ93600.1 hypothetical protein C7R91_20255 [Brevibacillus formosus]GED59478.1 hypothetical protein BFO01nite_36100 [Brevibacillus formosus]
MKLAEFFAKRGNENAVYSKNLSSKKKIPNSKFTPGFASLKQIVDEHSPNERHDNKVVGGK